MSSKEKAKELVDKYHSLEVSALNYKQVYIEDAKEQAKICVEEILWFMEEADPQALSYELIGYRDFYREVLREIELCKK